MTFQHTHSSYGTEVCYNALNIQTYNLRRTHPPQTHLQYTPTATHRICADGGANRLYDLAHALAPKDPNAHLTYLPDIVVGDLDSLRPDVRTAYTTAGVQVVNESNQDTTDLQKSLTYASRLLAPQVTLCPLGTNRDGGYPRLRPVVIAAGMLCGGGLLESFMHTHIV